MQFEPRGDQENGPLHIPTLKWIDFLWQFIHILENSEIEIQDS